MTDSVEHAKSALKGVTDGPWELIGGNEYVTGVSVCVAPDDGGVTGPDAAFIAASRTLVPELVAEVERLRSTLARALALAEQWDAATTWDGRKSVVRSFGEELRGVLTSDQEEVAE